MRTARGQYLDWFDLEVKIHEILTYFSRNAFLFEKGLPPPKMTKTGTTICGMIYKDGVILGADTRATGGNLVSDKNCRKIHQMAPNMMYVPSFAISQTI